MSFVPTAVSMLRDELLVRQSFRHAAVLGLLVDVLGRTAAVAGLTYTHSRSAPCPPS